MSSATKKDREFLFQFIRYYKMLPSLWNAKSKDYHDSSVKQKSYKLLLKKYREHYPTATLRDLKRKLNSLRSNFRRYYRRQRPGDPPPNLYWFNEMKFILGSEVENEIDVDACYSEQKRDETEVSMTDSFEEHEEEHLEEIDHLEIPVTDLKYNWETEENLSSPPLRFIQTNSEKPTLVYKESQHSSILRVEDEFDYWGKVMAAELRKLDEKQQIYAKKAITDILLEGQLGLLKRDSVQINKAVEL